MGFFLKWRKGMKSSSSSRVIESGALPLVADMTLEWDDDDSGWHRRKKTKGENQARVNQKLTSHTTMENTFPLSFSSLTNQSG